jgi:hypothetical protein
MWSLLRKINGPCPPPNTLSHYPFPRERRKINDPYRIIIQNTKNNQKIILIINNFNIYNKNNNVQNPHKVISTFLH